MELLNQFLVVISDFMYSYILIILLIGAGIYFTIRTRFPQLRYFLESMRVLKEKNQNENAVSSFQALMISTASRVGVGNIAGVSTAIALGGAGAVFWMWVIAILGSASAFVESTLAQIYKVKDENGKEYRGGPSYYIQQVLGKRWLGILFGIMLIACFAYGFNSLQSNTIVSTMEHYFGGEYSSLLIPAILGLVLAGLTAFVIFGGQNKIAFITSVIVPVMAILYLLLGFVTVIRNWSAIPQVFSMIFQEAFDFQAIFAGFTGSAIMLGMKRGLFSNEAGMGSAPNAAASAEVSHPVKQGLVQMLSVFIDTLLICSTTAFIILFSGIDTQGLKAMPLIQKVISSQFGEIGVLIISLSVFFFAFSSIIGNYYYTESNFLFISNKKKNLMIFRITVVVAVFLGSLSSYDLAWNLADVLMGLMTLINIPVILIIGKVAYLALDDYTKQRKEGKNPKFVAKNIGITNCQLWNEE